MKYFLTLVTLTVFVIYGQAQDFKFGKVSKEELQEKVYPLDSSANAAILYKKEDISFQFIVGKGFMQNREVHERIKIYNKEGYDWATKKIFLYEGSSSSKEKLINLKAYTYNLNGEKVKKEKLKNDGIFEEDYNEFYEVNTLTMPNIQDGCVIEYTYKIVSPFYQIDDVYFQKSIPIKVLDVKIATPQYMSYNKLGNPKAFYFPPLTENTEKKSVLSTSRSGGALNGGNFRSPVSFSRSKSEYYDNVIIIADTNIPAITEEAYAGNIDNYISKMSLEFAASLDDLGNVEKSYSSTWEQVSKTIFDSDRFGGQIKKSNFYKDDIKPITEGISNSFENASILMDYVKSKVKWNGYYGYSTIKGVKNAYKDGSGSVGDINLLLVSMLRSIGVEANPVLISTKDNGIPLFPTRKGFNYVVCMVEDQGNYILLDASEQYSSPNILPNRALNWQGRLIKEDGSSSWVSLMPSQQSLEMTSLNVKIAQDLSASGKVRQVVKSNMSISYKKKYIGLSNDDQVKAIEKNRGAIEVSNLELEDKDGNTFSGAYDYVLNDAVEDIGGKLYFSPLLFLAEKENPFKLDERQYPIDFSVPLKQKNIVNIMLPEGYQVESLPQSEVMEFAGGKIKYSFILKQNGNFVQLSTEFDLQTPFVSSTDYVVFKEFFGKVVAKQTEQIVLSKQ